MELKENKMYLTTGKFAKLCHTTKHTLFHYCDIGLFSPAYTDENGYRYYHVLQYDMFMTITQLRTIGMPLDEIKEYLAERSPQSMVELYERQEKQITAQISQLKRIRNRISTQRNNIQKVLTCSDPYFLEERDRCSLLCSDVVLPTDDYTMTAAIGGLVHCVNGKTSSDTLGMICKLEDAIHQDDYPFRFYIYAASAKQKNGRVKPAGTYLTTYHRGEYETLRRSYQAIASYADRHQLRLDNLVYAETIIGDWAVCQPQDYVIKVSVKVQGDEI